MRSSLSFSYGQMRDIIRNRSADVIVVSYPKSGRTWHRLALGAYVAKLSGLELSKALDTRKLTAKAGLPVVTYSHNGANFLDNVGPAHPFVASRLLWMNKRVVLLLRDPRDVLVSSYHHATERSRTFSGSLSAFVRNPATGIDKIMVALHAWKNNMNSASDVLIQSYESMHKDHQSALEDAVRFCGFGQPDSTIIDQCVEMSTFGRMQKFEEESFFDHGSMKGRKNLSGSKAGAKVREGRIGGYAGQMAAEDIAYVNERMKHLGNPFPDYLTFP
ncbi:MAG: sulfotransferase domain-containing protein [Proteobacteria bacterium]|nr:sulfotransferase domain-containing protein [Pseudomonadota bacterium]